MQPILVIETSSATCGIAIYAQTGDAEILVVREVSGVSGHSQSVLPLIDSVMEQACVTRKDLAAVAFDQGPGAFTGVRLGCSVAQGIGFTLKIPVVPVGALPALASGLSAQAHAGVRLVALDARMQEMYFAAYGPEDFELQAPVLIRAEDCVRFVSARLPYWIRALGGVGLITLAGEGWSLMPIDQLQAELRRVQSDLPRIDIDQHARVTVADVARLAWKLWRAGKQVSPEHALPLYLRDKVAFTTAERALGQGGNPKVSEPREVLLLPMSQADLAEVVELERESQAFPWTQGHFADALRAQYPAWVLRNSQELLGFCVAMVAPDEVHLLVIAVKQDVRGQSFGRQLMDQIYALAHQNAASRVLLEVRASNAKAISFYQKQGFEQIGTRRAYYSADQGQREDAWVMARGLHQKQLDHD